ncbi:MAG: SRPBCC family protein [Bacteroidales bacterium]|nr:SRPBCC family protein [Bacteroidales bacterium]
MNIQVDKNAKAFATDEVLINAPAEKVFLVLSDIRKWPLWQTSVNTTQIEGLPEEGKTFRWKAGGMKIISRLHTVVPFSGFGWTGRMLWISAVHNWEFVQNGSETRVKVSESMTGFGASLLQKTLSDGLKKTLFELKNEVERQ